tara:strand:+ start:248 stop:763 length:516 start_codon:yes stop_codon:yes gene_type:complete
MKKLLLLSALLIFACGSDSADNDSNITQNVLIVNGQEYPISRGVLQLVMGDSGDEVYQNLIFGQSTLPDNLFCGDYLYQGYYIDIAYQSNTSDGTGVFTDVFGDYDLFFDSTNQDEENFTVFGDNDNVSSALSVTKSGNIYTVELNTVDENGNSVEVYYNGANINIYECGF